MSLINEALKRARVEAARRDAAEKGVPPAALPIYVPRRRRPWLAPLLGFIVGLAAVGVAAGAFWLTVRQAPQEPPPQVAAAVVPAVVEMPEASTPAPVEPATVPQVEVAAQPTPPTPQPGQASAVAPTEPPVVRDPEDTPPRRPAASPVNEAPVEAVASRPESAAEDPQVVEPEAAVFEPLPEPRSPTRKMPPESPRSSDEQARTYLRQAELPGGGKVKVDFIVWSETRPFAQINGELVNPGQVKEGYILRQVERDRVELEVGGETLWIRVK